MKRIGTMIVLALLAGRAGAAQDTTKQAPAPAAAVPAGHVTLAEAAVARTAGDRPTQQTGRTFPGSGSHARTLHK